MKKKIKRISRGKVSDEQAAKENELRKKAMQDFPPKNPNPTRLPRTGIAAKLRKARKAQGLTRYAVAKSAGIPNPNTIKDFEEGTRDIHLSNVEAIAKALGISLEVVDR